MKLSIIEEEVLLKKILNLDSQGFLLILAIITNIANLISNLREGKGIRVID